MTPADARAVLAEVTYRPGWALALEDTYEGLLLRITATVPDAYHPETTTDLGIDSYVPLPVLREPADFLEWLLWRLRMVESHEAMEWFRVHGKPFRDPHAERVREAV